MRAHRHARIELSALSAVSAMSVVSATLLAACGGGGNSSATTDAPPTATLTLSGTAARGAAIAGATVQAKCTSGSATATTGSNGSYTINVTGGSLPCALELASAGGNLYSIAQGSGNTATANVTPLTQMVVAKLAGQDPAAFYASFGAASAAAVSAAAVGAAQTAVTTMLKNNGIDATAAGDFLTGTLVPASGSTPGNAQDKLLDSLAGAMNAAGVSLAQLSASLQQGGGSGASAAPSATPSVAADVALRPKAASCAALRSGRYQFVLPQIGAAGSGGNTSSFKVGIDAGTLVFTFPDATTSTLSAMAGAPCRFTDAAGADLVVSQAGVVALKSANGLAGIGFPEQALGLADLAGDWNLLGYDRGDTTQPLAPTAATITITAGGQLSFGTTCPEAKACAASTKKLTVASNAAGGFDLIFPDGSKSRLFAYRAGGGEMMFVAVGADGTHAIGTRTRSLALPAVGEIDAGYGTGATNAAASGGVYAPTAYDVSDYRFTVAAVDAAAGTLTRTTVLAFGGPVTRNELFNVNTVAGQARNGYLYRAAATVPNSNGVATTVRESVWLPLRGMGLTVAAFPAPSAAQAASTSFQYYVTKP